MNYCTSCGYVDGRVDLKPCDRLSRWQRVPAPCDKVDTPCPGTTAAPVLLGKELDKNVRSTKPFIMLAHETDTTKCASFDKGSLAYIPFQKDSKSPVEYVYFEHVKSNIPTLDPWTDFGLPTDDQKQFVGKMPPQACKDYGCMKSWRGLDGVTTLGSEAQKRFLDACERTVKQFTARESLTTNADYNEDVHTVPYPRILNTRQ